MSCHPDRERPLDGDIDPQEMVSSRKNTVFVDGVILNGPTTDARAGEKFVEEACRLIMEEVVLKATDINEKVCEWRPPEQLKQLLDLELRDTGEPHQRLLELCQDVIRYSVKTNHPRFFNQLYAGLDYYSLVARFMTEALNPSVYTYEVSPVFLLVEEAVLKKMIEFIGWKEGDGIFNPGGSVSNMYAMNLARYKYCPDIKEKGLSGLPRLILFTSAECHYSMKKAASFLGIGTENACFVETDGRGKMIPEELERQVWQAKKEGAAPFLVCATSGTTVLGAFDPLDEIADICERHGLWLHVDASWGGSALMSRKHRKLLHGIHRADSVAWNPHKMLMAGIQCCAFLVKDKSDLLKKCYSAKASYLFQQDKFYDVSYDTGDKSIQCSRRPDAFKFWMTWKALGTLGLEEKVNRALALSRYLVEEIKKREGFKLLMEPEYANVCFWYIPPSLREMEEGPEFWAKLHLVAPAIKERMMKKGSLMLGYQPHRGKVNFFRQVLISPQVRREDMDFLLDEIDLLGRDM
ncbi:acidic amino acid decarboxylase GADL1 isoform X1 [Balaenoptera ricei]|uniref:Acidic amino acid decarboxylase GADL1 n=3 Tax=Balaenoptera TaxID=9766 RepID=A0A8C0D5F9_BALMU|nr:acidic amino acid decarboxylase GADL1 isoform X1 [Balaenoptera acutorostrata]XP_036726665.1 acidic amino acid decarboxylase GADL1 [Balaenoptera musculus]XP_059793550.1 acidic amino acid decarboxylase GADL1 isoform X1 [Balaenoptera ricei]